MRLKTFRIKECCIFFMDVEQEPTALPERKDWPRIEASAGEAQNKAQQVLKDFELVYAQILDGHSRTDLWIHTGIHKEDLKNRNFGNVYATFVST